jgi:hypothetical protein
MVAINHLSVECATAVVLGSASRPAIPATLVGRAQTGQIQRLCRYSSKRVIDNRLIFGIEIAKCWSAPRV